MGDFAKLNSFSKPNETRDLLRTAQRLAQCSKELNIPAFQAEVLGNPKVFKDCFCTELCQEAKRGLCRHAINEVAMLFSKVSLQDLLRKLNLLDSDAKFIRSLVEEMLKDGSLVGSCEDRDGACIVSMKPVHPPFDSESSADSLQELLDLLISAKKDL